MIHLPLAISGHCRFSFGPVTALYEQRRVSHVGDLTKLTDQMLQITGDGYTGAGSPDRLDALVWAIIELGMKRAQTVVKVHAGLY